jgi:nitroreductase
LKVIKSAQSAPSACNRQSVKVFHVKGEERCKGILDIQGGSKGFSQVNDVLIVASDLSLYTNALEVNTCYVDSGLFAMNLLLALHYYKIGSCPLLWNDETERGEQLRKIVSIPEKYEIALVIPIGYYPEEVKYSVSKRKEVFEVYERV